MYVDRREVPMAAVMRSCTVYKTATSTSTTTIHLKMLGSKFGDGRAVDLNALIILGSMGTCKSRASTKSENMMAMREQNDVYIARRALVLVVSLEGFRSTNGRVTILFDWKKGIVVPINLTAPLYSDSSFTAMGDNQSSLPGWNSFQRVGQTGCTDGKKLCSRIEKKQRTTQLSKPH